MATKKLRVGTQLPANPTAGDVFIQKGAADKLNICETDGVFVGLPGPFDFAESTVETSTDYTTLVDDLMVIVDPTPTDVTITLIDGATVLRPVFVNHDALATAGKRVFVQGTGGQLLNGEAILEIPKEDSLSFAFKNGRWVVY